VLGVVLPLFAQEPAFDEELNLTELQKEARAYRREGLQAQNIGDFTKALEWYQKAVQLDPTYAVTYNDLGVIYELTGDANLAEEYYLKANQINPKLLSPYSNLALLYENKHDLQKAGFFWKKRAALGAAADPWTQRAKRRWKEIRLATQPQEIRKTEAKTQAKAEVKAKSKAKALAKTKVKPKVESKIKPQVEAKARPTPGAKAKLKTQAKAEASKPKEEAKATATKTQAKATAKIQGEQVTSLLNAVAREKVKQRQDNKTIAKKYLQQAKQSCGREEYTKAIQEAINAEQLDPANKEISEFLEKVLIRALSR
jgi:tetratricopeptide (TPR) repeat protein